MQDFPRFMYCENFLTQKTTHWTPTKLRVAHYKGHEKWQLLFGSQIGKDFLFCVEQYFWFPFGKSWKTGNIMAPSDSRSGFSNSVEMWWLQFLSFYMEPRVYFMTRMFSFLIRVGSRDSVVGIATSYGLDDRGVGVRVPVGSRIVSSPNRTDRLWGPPDLLSNGYRG
jgi:hypothetical protein